MCVMQIVSHYFYRAPPLPLRQALDDQRDGFSPGMERRRHSFPSKSLTHPRGPQRTANTGGVWFISCSGYRHIILTCCWSLMDDVTDLWWRVSPPTSMSSSSLTWCNKDPAVSLRGSQDGSPPTQLSACCQDQMMDATTIFPSLIKPMYKHLSKWTDHGHWLI